jgi:hypothetical protein
MADDGSRGGRPLSPEECFAVIGAVDGRAVLAAGQAVAWWAEYYAAQGRLPEVAEPTGMYVSKDIDFLADVTPRVLDPILEDVAARLHGRVERNRAEWTSVITAVVEFLDDDGVQRRVDFLRDVPPRDRGRSRQPFVSARRGSRTST